MMNSLEVIWVIGFIKANKFSEDDLSMSKDLVEVAKSDFEIIEAMRQFNPMYWKQLLLTKYLNHNLQLEVGLDDLLKGLYLGFEIEYSPKDKVRVLYETAIKEEMLAKEAKDLSRVEYWSGQSYGVIQTLNALNLKIVGVNHE